MAVQSCAGVEKDVHCPMSYDCMKLIQNQSTCNAEMNTFRKLMCNYKCMLFDAKTMRFLANDETQLGVRMWLETLSI